MGDGAMLGIFFQNWADLWWLLRLGVPFWFSYLVLHVWGVTTPEHQQVLAT